jgi:hypothetical protein
LNSWVCKCRDSLEFFESEISRFWNSWVHNSKIVTFLCAFLVRISEILESTIQQFVNSSVPISETLQFFESLQFFRDLRKSGSLENLPSDPRWLPLQTNTAILTIQCFPKNQSGTHVIVQEILIILTINAFKLLSRSGTPVLRRHSNVTNRTWTWNSTSIPYLQTALTTLNGRKDPSETAVWVFQSHSKLQFQILECRVWHTHEQTDRHNVCNYI